MPVLPQAPGPAAAARLHLLPSCYICSCCDPTSGALRRSRYGGRAALDCQAEPEGGCFSCSGRASAPCSHRSAFQSRASPVTAAATKHLQSQLSYRGRHDRRSASGAAAPSKWGRNDCTRRMRAVSQPFRSNRRQCLRQHDHNDLPLCPLSESASAVRTPGMLPCTPVWPPQGPTRVRHHALHIHLDAVGAAPCWATRVSRQGWEAVGQLGAGMRWWPLAGVASLPIPSLQLDSCAACFKHFQGNKLQTL